MRKCRHVNHLRSILFSSWIKAITIIDDAKKQAGTTAVNYFHFYHELFFHVILYKMLMCIIYNQFVIFDTTFISLQNLSISLQG